LPHRDHAAIAGEEIPHLSEDEQAYRLDHQPERAGIRPPRQRGEEAGERGAAPEAGAAVTDGVRGGGTRHGDQSRVRGKRPSGRVRSTARQARWPTRIPQPGSKRKPTACATPRMTPPPKVPQNEPMPPMITASKA